MPLLLTSRGQQNTAKAATGKKAFEKSAWRGCRERRLQSGVARGDDIVAVEAEKELFCGCGVDNYRT